MFTKPKDKLDSENSQFISDNRNININVVFSFFLQK